MHTKCKGLGVSPIHICAERYWDELLKHHQRVKSGWLMLPWKELPKETIAITCLRINDYLGTGIPLEEEYEHEEWVKLKRRAGWRYGSAYEPAMKEHPMLIPWGALKTWQKQVTEAFIATVRGDIIDLEKYNKEIGGKFICPKKKTRRRFPD